MTKLIYFSITLFFAHAASAAVPSAWEPEFAKAVLDFHDGKYGQTLSRLEKIPSSVRRETEVRELKALTLRRLSRWDAAAAEYQSLISESRRTKADTRPYQFELGVIEFEQKKYEPATKRLSQSFRNGFNKVAATYFLGMIALEGKRFDRAETFFRYVAASNVKSLRPLANLYLAQIASQSNRTLASLKQYSRASSQAKMSLNDPNSPPESRRISRQVVDAVDKVIMSLQQSRINASVGLLAGYDSNVLFTANNVTSPAEGPSGRGSLQNILQYGVSYSSPALSKWQSIVNFQGSVAYHYNRTAEQGDAINNDVSYYLTRDPLGDLTYGARIGVTGALRNALDSTTNTNRYRTYLLGATVGPYVQYSLGETLRLGGELFYQPRRFFLDSETTATFQQTGATYFARIYLRDHRGAGYFNPSVYLSGNISHTRGVEYRGQGMTLAFANRFHLSGKSVLAGSVSVGTSSFKDREGENRFDVPTSLGVNYLYRLTDNVDLFGDFVYNYNFSNISDPYEFNRYRLALSGTYRF